MFFDNFIFSETRDFLAFLRRIQYDHRQCPDINGKAVDIDVSIVVSNIRAVSEVTMVCFNQGRSEARDSNSFKTLTSDFICLIF